MTQPSNQVILQGLDMIFLVNIIIEIKTIDDQIKYEKLQYDVNREAAKYQLYHLVNLINMNTLLVKKYYHLINNK